MPGVTDSVQVTPAHWRGNMYASLSLKLEKPSCQDRHDDVSRGKSRPTRVGCVGFTEIYNQAAKLPLANNVINRAERPNDVLSLLSRSAKCRCVNKRPSWWEDRGLLLVCPSSRQELSSISSSDAADSAASIRCSPALPT